MTGTLHHSEKRAFGRRQTYLHGWVKIPGRPAHSCVLRNLSDTGAFLEFQDAVVLPDRFHLKIEGLNEVRGCEVRHSSGRGTGVIFCPAADVSNWRLGQADG